jgi:hypothetical protein
MGSGANSTRAPFNPLEGVQEVADVCRRRYPRRSHTGRSVVYRWIAIRTRSLESLAPPIYLRGADGIDIYRICTYPEEWGGRVTARVDDVNHRGRRAWVRGSALAPSSGVYM